MENKRTYETVAELKPGEFIEIELDNDRRHTRGDISIYLSPHEPILVQGEALRIRPVGLSQIEIDAERL